jgi:NADPH:quinone reductase-like Zn-dependent oxidoreductase
MVGGDYVAKEIEVLNTSGRLVMIATQAGGNVEIALPRIMQKRLVLTGSTLRPRGADEKARLAAAVEKTVWPWIAAGKLKTVIDKTFPLDEAAKAHAQVESGSHVGKVVLTM